MLELVQLQQNYNSSVKQFNQALDLAHLSYDNVIQNVIKDAQLMRFCRAVEDLTHFYLGYCYFKHNIEIKDPQDLLAECLKNNVVNEEEVNGLSKLIELAGFFASASCFIEDVEEARITFLPLAQPILTSFTFITQNLAQDN